MIKIATTTHINKQNKEITTNYRTSTLQKHKLNDTLYQFKDQFCINDVLAKIENNSLKIILT